MTEKQKKHYDLIKSEFEVVLKRYPGYIDSMHLARVLNTSTSYAWKVLESLHKKGYLTKEEEKWLSSKRKFVIYKLKDD